MSPALSVVASIKGELLGTTWELALSQRIKSHFNKYSSRDEATGERYMTENDFIEAITPAGEDFHKIKREKYAILFHVADRRRTGRVNFHDWAFFENLLSKPDAEYLIAFQLFDVEGTGAVSFENFQKLYSLNKSKDSIPFDWSSDWATLYLGGKKRRHEMTYNQFAQMLHGFQGEQVRQAFRLLDTDGDGLIELKDFQRIILETAKHKLSDNLLENLPTLCCLSTGRKISYATVRAFQNIVREMDFINIIVRVATSKSCDGKITKTDFLNEAARVNRFTLFTPMEADILFHLAGLDEPSGRLSMGDFAKVFDSSWHNAYDMSHDVACPVKEELQSGAMSGKQFFHNIIESLHHFGLGSIAGTFGAFVVYPVDLVKTRMQNQRSQHIGEKLYRNSIDCARRVIKSEGVRGLYTGVLPQLVGVAPEKAIKLSVNDLIRSHYKDKNTGKIWWPHEILAGGSAGACQVIFTNPLEIVKIRLQVQGEATKTLESTPKCSAMWVVRSLGLAGLYKGASACLLRDVPFSAIYFPAYGHLKSDLFGENQNKKLGVMQLLTAGAIAGMPSAYLTTPCDVIKTRLQVEARKGETRYNSLGHCVKTIWREEGFRAFFKGGPARVLRSSPQFGCTLAAYEILQKALPLPGGAPAETPRVSSGCVEPGIELQETRAPLAYLRSRNALRMILDLNENFGIPRSEAVKPWLSFLGVRVARSA